MRDTSANRTLKEGLLDASQSEIFFQLEENFRMNPNLCNFVELIYQKKFQPSPIRRDIARMGFVMSEYLESAKSEVHLFLKGVSEVMQFGKSETMNKPPSLENVKGPIPTSLFLVNLVPRLDQWAPLELHLKLEAKMVANLVSDLSIAFEEEKIFVVTPHRVQRSLITSELSCLGVEVKTAQNGDSKRIWADTTERMQGELSSIRVKLSIGSEADIVVCVFSHTHKPSLRRDLDFLYNRPRLNVAISRAKTLSIVISSEGVLNPPVEALVEKGNLEGFTYLKAFQERAWNFHQIVEGNMVDKQIIKYYLDEGYN